MKKISSVKKSKKDSLSEDSETEYCQRHVKYFKDTRSLVNDNDKLQKYLQTENSLLHRYNDNDSDNDYSEKIQYNKKSKKRCGCCKKETHNTNDCPLFMNAIKQQNSMLSIYNTTSRNHSHHMDHFSNYDETAGQHELVQNEYFRKYCSTDQKHLEFYQKTQKKCLSKHCKYCKGYGHLEDKCTILEKVAHREPDTNWRDIESKKSKKKNTLKTVHDLSEIDHSAGNCVEETTENCFSKYCYFCKENGHTENICPLVQKALKKQKGKNLTVFPKINKKDNFSNATTKVKGIKKLKTCNFCENSDHKEDDCTEKKHYFKKNGHNYKEQVQLKDVCPSLEEDIRKLEYKKASNKCNFCGDLDHSKSECVEKFQLEYISKYCHYCDEYGHFEDTCPLVEQAAEKMEHESYCKTSLKCPKKVSFSNDITPLTEKLEALKICPICDEFGHNENDCFVLQQAEYCNKYCDRCKENGHYETDCALNKQSSSNSKISNNFSKKELEFQSICSDHCVCENCHDVYCEESNSSKWKNCSPKNAKKTYKENTESFRYCTLCGVVGLVDTCILKQRSNE